MGQHTAHVTPPSERRALCCTAPGAPVKPLTHGSTATAQQTALNRLAIFSRPSLVSHQFKA